MSQFTVFDEAHLFRIEIAGELAGETTVDHVRKCWQGALCEDVSRRITVDISQMTGYDQFGLTLLRELCEHGVYLAARTSESLGFLSEISAPGLLKPQSLTGTPPIRKTVDKAVAQPMIHAAGAS